MCKVIAITNQKGGCAKTNVTVNLGIGLAREGKKVALIDNDAQGSLTASLGYEEPDELNVTLANIMMNVINDEENEPEYGFLQHEEGVCFIPANVELSGLEISLINVISRETILRSYIETIRDQYDYILIDCAPSLGMLTINALVAADAVIIPVPAAYLPVKGLVQLLKTISMVKRRLNRKLQIEGILITMADFRTNFAKDISAKLHEAYDLTIGIFKTYIPQSVRAAECGAEGISIYKHDPNGNVADAYHGDLVLVHPEDKQLIDGIMDLILETVLCDSEKILVASNWYSAELVKSKLLKLNYSHMEYVLHCFKQNTTKVKNIKKYMLAVLFNAPTTIDSYYMAEVNSGLADNVC